MENYEQTETVHLLASPSVEAPSAADLIPSPLAYSGPSQTPVTQQYPTPNALEIANQHLPPAVPGMVYLQSYALTPPGQPYAQTGYVTAQAGYIYSRSPPPVNCYYGPQQPLSPSQQQQQVVYVNSQQTPALKPVVRMSGAIVLSCYVFWFCGVVFGGIAFILYPVRSPYFLLSFSFYYTDAAPISTPIE